MLSDQKSTELTRQAKFKILLNKLGPTLASLAVILVIALAVFFLVRQTDDSNPIINAGKEEQELVREKNAATQNDAAAKNQTAQQQQLMQQQKQQATPQPNLPEDDPAASDTQPSAEEAAKNQIESQLSSIDSQFSGLDSSEFKESDISDSALSL